MHCYLQDSWDTRPQCSQAAHPCGNMSQMRCPTSSVKQVCTDIFLGTGVKHTSDHQKLWQPPGGSRSHMSEGAGEQGLCVELGPQVGRGLVGSLYSTAVR